MIPVKVENNTSLDQVQDALNCVGYAVVEDVLDEASLAATRDRMYRDGFLPRLAKSGWQGPVSSVFFDS